MPTVFFRAAGPLSTTRIVSTERIKGSGTELTIQREVRRHHRRDDTRGTSAKRPLHPNARIVVLDAMLDRRPEAGTSFSVCAAQAGPDDGPQQFQCIATHTRGGELRRRARPAGS